MFCVGPEYAGSTHASGACRPGSIPGGPTQNISRRKMFWPPGIESRRPTGRGGVAQISSRKLCVTKSVFMVPGGPTQDISRREMSWPPGIESRRVTLIEIYNGLQILAQRTRGTAHGPWCVRTPHSFYARVAPYLCWCGDTRYKTSYPRKSHPFLRESKRASRSMARAT